MRQFLHLIGRFRRDERGAFAVIFAVLAIVLVAMSGAVVDFTSMQQSRTKAQVALDASALALEPTIYTSTASTIQTQAQALLVDRLADPATTWANCTTNGNKAPCVTVGTPVLDTVNGQLTLTASLKVQMNFVSLVGVPTLTAQLTSVATRKKLNIEIAMVLDNSGSMDTSMTGGHTRMYNLQASANCAANILFYSVTTCAASTTGKTKNTGVKMAVVPFTSAVNVGTSNASASWIDRTGTGNISDNNFDNDDEDSTAFNGTVDRITILNGGTDSAGTVWSGVANSGGWGGCVEARYNNGGTKQYDTDDTLPDATQPDTLFTPYFAPDEVGGSSVNTAGGSESYGSQNYFNSYLNDSPSSCDRVIGCTWTEVKTKCNSWTDCKTTGSSPGTDTSTYVKAATTYTHPPSTCDCNSSTILTDSGTGTFTGSGSYGKTYTRLRTCNDTYTPTGLSARELQERMCKYNQASMAHSPDQGYVYGPNGDCPFNPITPLTNTPATIAAAVTAMAPQGATNVAEGAAWGFRVLSPGAPFTEGGAYDAATSKIMIVMTDGENTRYPYSNMNDAQYYSPYGYPSNTNGRLGTATTDAHTLEQRVNDRLSATCANAKLAGITVYTIGLATSSTDYPTENTTLLTNCASQTAYAFFPTSASQLQDAFVAIANQLAALRIAQ